MIGWVGHRFSLLNDRYIYGVPRGMAPAVMVFDRIGFHFRFLRRHAQNGTYPANFRDLFAGSAGLTKR